MRADSFSRFYDEVFPRATAPLMGATCPIYSGGHHLPCLIGSSVLVRLDKDYFILTAAHVLEEAKKTHAYFGIGNSLVDLRGPIYFTGLPPGGSRDGDPVDLAVVFADTSRWPELEPSAAVGLEQILSNRINAGRDLHILIGFPCSRQPRRPAGTLLNPTATTFAGPCLTADDVQKAGYKADLNLLIEFDKENVYSSRGKAVAPDPIGMSGGGIWRCPDLYDSSNPQSQLAGVAIAWQRGPSKCILGTRITPCFALIARERPDLRPTLDDYFI